MCVAFSGRRDGWASSIIGTCCITGYDDVGRLKIAMHETLAVRLRKPRRELLGKVEDPSRVERRFPFDDRLKGGALH